MDSGQFVSGIASATSSLQKLDKQSTLTRRGLDNFFKGKGVDEMKSQFIGVERVLDNLEKKMSNSSNGIRQQMKAMTVAAQELEQTYRNLSDAEKQSGAGQELRQHIDELISKAGELKDTMGDVQGAISFASSDTAQLQAFAQGLSALSAGAQVATGALSLFGVSEEKIAAVQKTIITLIGITNGLQLIQNALQKESNLMQFISIARNQGLAVALGLKTAAQAAATGAITAETGAVNANTAAWALNPIGAIVIAVTAAVAAIWLLVEALNEASTAEAQAAMIAEEFDKQMESQAASIGEQIQTFKNLQDEYNRCGGNVDKLTKFVHDNQKQFDKCKISVKNVDQANKIFSNNSSAYVTAARNRGIAMAQEATEAALLGKTIAELSKVYAAFVRGQEVNWSDLKKTLRDVTGWSDIVAEAQMRAAGLSEEGEFWGKNNVKGSSEAFTKLMKAAVDDQLKVMENSWDKLQKALKNDVVSGLQDIDSAMDRYEDEQSRGGSKGGSKRGSKGGSKRGSKSSGSKGGSSGSSKPQKELQLTDEEVKSLSTSWDGLNKIIEVANKKINSLDKNSANYNETLKRYNSLILAAQKAKYNLIDTSTTKGLAAAKSQIKTIIDLLPEGSEELKKWKKEEENLNKKIAERSTAYINMETLGGMAEAKSDILSLIKLLDIHSDQAKKLAKRWYEIDKAEKAAKQTLDDMMNGIDSESPAALRKQIQDLENEKLKLNPEVDWSKISNIDFKIDWLKGELGRKMAMINGVSVTVPAKLDITFDYKKSSLEKYREKIDYLGEEISKLNDIKLEDVGDEVFNKAQKSLRELREELQKTKREANLTEIKEDMKEYAKTLGDSVYEGTKNFVSGINSVYSSISGLSDKLDDAKNGFEAFVAVFDTVMTIFDAVKSTIETIKGISQAFNLLSGATQAYNLLTDNATKSIITQSVALTESAVAQTEKTAADGASTPIATANAAALKTQAIAATETAASLMFAAHASIPFVGAALGAAQVGIMEGVLAALKASVVGLFANGGIVGGSSYHGDKIYARVNSGEAILNKRQQSNLFRLIDGGHPLGNGSANVEFKIKGSELIGVIKNYNDKHSKLR